MSTLAPSQRLSSITTNTSALADYQAADRMRCRNIYPAWFETQTSNWYKYVIDKLYRIHSWKYRISGKSKASRSQVKRFGDPFIGTSGYDTFIRIYSSSWVLQIHTSIIIQLENTNEKQIQRFLTPLMKFTTGCSLEKKWGVYAKCSLNSGRYMVL